MTSNLEFLGLVSAQRLQREVQVVGLGQRPQVEVVLRINTRRHVDVKLQQLQKLSLQLVPENPETERGDMVRKAGRNKPKKQT